MTHKNSIKIIQVLLISISFLSTPTCNAFGFDWFWDFFGEEKESGDIISEKRDVKDFKNIVLMGSGKILLEQSNKEELVVEAEDAIISLLETKVEDGTLIIKKKRKNIFSSSSSYVTPKFHVKVKNLDSVKIIGSGKLYTSNIKSDGLSITLIGAGFAELKEITNLKKIEINGSAEFRGSSIEAKDFEVIISGSGEIKLSGTTNNQKIEINGSGDYKAYDFESKKCEISVSGSGDAHVWVLDYLKAKVSGSGDILYKGAPKSDLSVAGSGRIKQKK